MPKLRVLVLAASRKRAGLCVAGYRLDDGGWIRPISDDPAGTLYPKHYTVEGRDPQLLDVVEIEVDEHQPDAWQPENWLLSDQPWELVETANPAEVADDLRSIVDHEARLLDETDRTIPASTYEKDPLDHSLVLVRPDSDLRWVIETPPWGGKQRKARFTIDGFGPYEFLVTDPVVEDALKKLPNGVHERSAVGIDDDEDVLLTISCTEPFAARSDRVETCSKLVAGVIRLPQ